MMRAAAVPDEGAPGQAQDQQHLRPPACPGPGACARPGPPGRRPPMKHISPSVSTGTSTPSGVMTAWSTGETPMPPMEIPSVKERQVDAVEHHVEIEPQAEPRARAAEAISTSRVVSTTISHDDLAARHADGLEHPQLAGALEDRHQHGVDHAQGGDDEDDHHHQPRADRVELQHVLDVGADLVPGPDQQLSVAARNRSAAWRWPTDHRRCRRPSSSSSGDLVRRGASRSQEALQVGEVQVDPAPVVLRGAGAGRCRRPRRRPRRESVHGLGHDVQRDPPAWP